jgi:methylenetetrahydrofolate reductase (NADPH)
VKLTEKINRSKDSLFSFEILPPLKGKSIDSIYKGIDPLLEFKPAFIDVTYHREEYILKPRDNGMYERIVTRKRPGTVAICAAIKNRYNLEAVPHLICGGFTKTETENALIDLNFLGVENVLALRGDNMKHESSFVPEENGNSNSIELIQQIKRMNDGIYLDEDLSNANKTDFCIGAAGYPEKHMEAPNMRQDLEFLKKKVDAGADFIVTQMFFDNKKYFEFVESCRSMGIDVPIIPGIKPLTSRNHLHTLPRVFHIDIPEDLSIAVNKAKTDDKVEEAGIEWCQAQCKELIQAGVPVIHFYTMGKSNATKRVAEAIF